MHTATGGAADTSLFGWVVRRFPDGWLTCNDGPGEAADFVHVDPTGLLSLVHVKAARNDTPARRIAATAYEVVTAQAVKNLPYLTEPGLFRARLERTGAGSASWSDGQRVADHGDVLEALDLRDATSRKQVVIVQPHVSKTAYKRLADIRRAGGVSDDLLRLDLIESLLNGAASDVAGRGGQLVVVGSLT